MEILACFVIFFLLITDISETPPSRIVPNIIVKSLLKGPLCLGEILVINMFMSTQGMCIGVLRIELDCSCKKLQGLLMLFL